VSDSRTLRRYSVAVENELRPTARTGIVLGIAHHWLDKDAGAGDDASSAALGAYMDVAPRTRVRGAVARTIRFPNIRQLYDEDGGNSALETERAFTAELGVEQRLSAETSLTLTGFRTLARNFIERPSQGEPFANNDTYRFLGVEATAESRVLPPLLLRARYTYLDAEDRSEGRAREALQYRPRHRGSVEARYAFPFALTASLTLLHVADQVYYSRRGPVERRHLPDYTLVGARLAQSLGRSGVQLYVGADNLLDERYEEEYGSPAATRVLYGGLSLRSR
jgi:outer membrane cobalamin receptor